MSERLRLFPLWLFLGWGLVALVAWVALMPNPPEVGAGLPHVDKLHHLAAYAVLGGWFAQLFDARGLRWLHAALLIGIGIGLEYLQGAGGVRHFEVADMVANTLGVLLGLGLRRTPLGRILPWAERTLLGGPKGDRP